MSLSPHERDFVLDGIDQDLRVDGRGRLDHRSLTLELGTSPQASGSARLRLGSTDVMVAVRADIGTPPAGFPTHGRLSCAVELSASADPAYEGRGGEKAAAELSPRARARLAGRFRGRRGFVIRRRLRRARRFERPRRRRRARDGEPGHPEGQELLGFAVRLPGALRGRLPALDALSVAIKAALADCKIPKVTAVAGPNHGDPTELELDDDPEQCARLDVSRVPLVATAAARFGTRNVVDATRDESALGDYALAVAVDKEGNVRGVSTMSTSDGKSVDVSSLRAMTKAARDVARRMHAATDAFLVAAVSRAEDEEDDEDDGA